MSSINSVSNSYSQIYATQSSQTASAQGKHHHHHQKSNSDLAVSDQVSISSDGIAALQKDRMQNHRVNPLDSLVESGTITQDQKDAIDAAFKSARDSEKIAESGVANTDPLAALVTDGTLTEDQESAIKDAFKTARAGRPDGPPPGGRPPGPPPSSGASSKQIDSVLSSLVSDGTLTTDQKSAVQKTLQSMMDALTETSESDGDSDDTNSTSSTTTTNSLFDDILANLVSKGTLTEEQKKTVTETLQAYNPYNVSK